LTEKTTEQIINKIWSGIRDYEDATGLLIGERIDLVILGKVCPTTIALTIKVSPKFWCEIRACSAPLLVSVLRICKDKQTLFGVPVFIQRGQKEDFIIVER
jgi:hypothetical protein